MPIVVPVDIPALATPLPDPADRNTYGTRGRLVWEWENNDLVPGANALADATYQNALEAESSALIAAGAANFQGEWSTRTGAANVPYAVWHTGRVWALLNNLADVTASEPGVSADWADVGGVRRSGDTMTGPLSVPSGASGSQVPQAQEIPSLVGIVGAVVYFPANVAPAGWIKSNGAALSRTTYAALYSYAAASGNLVDQGSKQAGNFGTGDGSTTFTLPDLRGEFPRGWDDGRGVDSGRAIGTAQAGDIQSHTHIKANNFGNAGTAFPDASVWAKVASNNEAGPMSTGATGGTETRPRNVALLACIKF